jgi:hypothetical protein
MSANEQRDGIEGSIDLVLVPSRARMLKAEPLPDGGTCCGSPRW